MGNIITSIDFRTVIPAASSEQPEFPATNLDDYTHPKRCWRAQDLVAGSTYAELQMATGTVWAVIIDDINIDTAAVSWDGGSAQIGISQDLVDGRYKAYVPIGVSTSFVRVTAETNETTTTEDVMRIGSLVALTTATLWTYNPGFPCSETTEQAVILNDDFSSGNDEPIEMGDKRAVIKLSTGVQPITQRSSMFTNIANLSQAQPLMYYRNNGDTSQVYICHRVGSTEVAQTTANAIAFTDLTLREYL